MIKDITLTATSREGIGKGPARRLRTAGLIPAAVYGQGTTPAAVSVNAKELAAILRSDSGHNTIFKLALPGAETSAVMIKEWQVDPVKGRLLHADIVRLSMTTTMTVSVAIEIYGEPIGVKLENGVLEITLREVEVECLPSDIPEHIRLDVSDLHLGKHMLVRDLEFDREKIKLVTDEDKFVAGVLAPRMVEEVAPAAGEEPAAAEPEVAKKGKGDE